jgi:hypothetical protein
MPRRILSTFGSSQDAPSGHHSFKSQRPAAPLSTQPGHQRHHRLELTARQEAGLFWLPSRSDDRDRPGANLRAARGCYGPPLARQPRRLLYRRPDPAFPIARTPYAELGHRPDMALLERRHRQAASSDTPTSEGGGQGRLVDWAGLWLSVLAAGQRQPTPQRGSGAGAVSPRLGLRFLGAGAKPDVACRCKAGAGRERTYPWRWKPSPISLKPGVGITYPLLCFPAFGCADLGRPSRAAYPRFAVQAHARLF